MAKERTEQKGEERQYRTLQKDELQKMWAKWAKFKPYYSNNHLVYPEALYLNENEGYSWSPQYGWSVYEAPVIGIEKYLEHKNYWQQYSDYEHNRQFAEKSQLNFYQTPNV